MSKVQPSDGQLTIIDGEGNEKLCQILFTVESEEFNSKYVVFYPIEEMESEEDKIELMAAKYQENEDGNGELFQIETDEEWAFLEEAVQQYEDDYSEDDCCCNGEDCDSDGCEEGHCCCHHHEE